MNGYSGIYLVSDLFIDALGRQWFTEFSLRALLSATLVFLRRSVFFAGDFTRSLDGDTARGSALECAACLDVLIAKTIIEESVAHEGKALLLDIASMLIGLIRSNSSSRDV